MFCCRLPNGTICTGAEIELHWHSHTSTKRTRGSTPCVSPPSLDMKLTQLMSLSEVGTPSLKVILMYSYPNLYKDAVHKISYFGRLQSFCYVLYSVDPPLHFTQHHKCVFYLFRYLGTVHSELGLWWHHVFTTSIVNQPNSVFCLFFWKMNWTDSMSVGRWREFLTWTLTVQKCTKATIRRIE